MPNDTSNFNINFKFMFALITFHFVCIIYKLLYIMQNIIFLAYIPGFTAK